MTSVAIACALGAAQALGLPVFPVGGEKSPTCSRGFRAAAAESAAIRELWHCYPGPLVGVPTGEESGIDVLDVGGPRHPEAAKWFAARRSRMPATRVHRSCCTCCCGIGRACAVGRPYWDPDPDHRVAAVKREWQKQADAALRSHPDYEPGCERIRELFEQARDAARALEDPLAQDAAARRPTVTEGAIFDTVAACPSLTIVETARKRERRVKEEARLASAVAAACDARVATRSDHRALAEKACREAWSTEGRGALLLPRSATDVAAAARTARPGQAELKNRPQGRGLSKVVFTLGDVEMTNGNEGAAVQGRRKTSPSAAAPTLSVLAGNGLEQPAGTVPAAGTGRSLPPEDLTALDEGDGCLPIAF
jgi:hypothetical protein